MVGMNQLVLGAVVPFAVAALVYFLRGRRAGFMMLIAVPVCMFLSTVWAVVPDIPRLVGRYDLYSRLSRDPRCDIFYWHYTIDLSELHSDSPLYALALIVMLVLLQMAVLREMRIAEKED